MPILRKESEIYPDDLFISSDSDEPWEVAHVRSRQEKMLARFLRREQIPFYLPQIERKVRRSGRQFISFLPLFPGYVFIRARSRSGIIWRSHLVVKLVQVPDQQRLSFELKQIRFLQESGASLTPASPGLFVGDPVRICEGVFQDYVGTVIGDKKALRLIVSVSMLNKAVIVEFPRDLLERVGPVSGRRPPRA